VPPSRARAGSQRNRAGAAHDINTADRTAFTTHAPRSCANRPVSHPRRARNGTLSRRSPCVLQTKPSRRLSRRESIASPLARGCLTQHRHRPPTPDLAHKPHVNPAVIPLLHHAGRGGARTHRRRQQSIRRARTSSRASPRSHSGSPAATRRRSTRAVAAVAAPPARAPPCSPPSPAPAPRPRGPRRSAA
jgi:hypothetical protein